VPVVAAAVCPHPPLLVPQLAGRTAGELDDLRAACAGAVDVLAAAGPDTVLVVGAGERTGERFGPDVTGSFAAFGAAGVTVDLGRPGPPADLPLPLLAGAWILAAAELDLPSTAVTVAADASPAECLELGRTLAAAPERVALLVMGDGSPRHSEHAPGHLHPAAPAFDEVVADCLAAGDRDGLARLDPRRADEVRAAGRPAWQVLAGATEGRDWKTELTYHAAPYGVGYFVAHWT
jgi:Catalytic LigB subunit of aromatic ring-opening dioxygenase